jgi:hypothetical protein
MAEIIFRCDTCGWEGPNPRLFHEVRHKGDVPSFEDELLVSPICPECDEKVHLVE